MARCVYVMRISRKVTVMDGTANVKSRHGRAVSGGPEMEKSVIRRWPLYGFKCSFIFHVVDASVCFVGWCNLVENNVVRGVVVVYGAVSWRMCTMNEGRAKSGIGLIRPDPSCGLDCNTSRGNVSLVYWGGSQLACFVYAARVG